MRPDSCTHPGDRVEWRKWPPSMGGAVRFRRQCLECLEGLGPKDTRPLDLPDDVDPGALLMAKLPPSRKGRTGLGGRGNARRRDYEAYMRSPQWRGRGGVRDRVLIRDRNRCQFCGARATEVAHVDYPDDIWNTRAENCKASCRDCNQREREQRIASGVLGCGDSTRRA